MSFSEKDNLEVNQDVKETESTIFADSAHYNEKQRESKEKNRKSPIINLVAVLLAVAIAVGAYFAVDLLVPEPEENKNPDSILIDVLATSAEYVKEIKIKNEKSQYKIMPKFTQSSTESSTEWILDGVKPEYTDSSIIEEVAGAVLNIDAVREIKDTAGDYGFDDAAIMVEVVGDGESLQNYTVTIGDNAPADLGCYCKVSTSDKVYIIESSYVLALQKEPIEFAVTTGYTGITQTVDNLSYFTNGELYEFDSINISGTKYGKTITIKPQTDEAINAYFAYIVTSPVKRIANDEQVVAVLDAFGKGIASVGAYSYKKDAAILKKYNLDKPEVVMTVTLGKKKSTIKFSVVDDLYCALIDDKTDMIHKVPISTLTFSQNKMEDYYSTFIILETLSGLSGMKVKTPDGKQYNFDLKYTPADDKNNVSQKYQAFYNGKELDIDNFKRFYQKMIALTPISHENKTGLKTQASITLVHSSGTDDVVLTFKKYSSARYQVELDGIPMGLITSTAFDELMDATVKAANGETVKE